MKKIIFLNLFVLIISIHGLAQMTNDDFEYVTKKYLKNSNSELYDFVEVGNWGLTEGSTSRSISFIELKAKGRNEDKGVILIFKIVNDGNSRETVYCLPARLSNEEIWFKAFKLLGAEKDEKVLKTFIWALMNYSQLKK